MEDVELLFSMITFSTLMNNTVNNQGNHCIAATNDGTRPAVISGNQMLTGDPGDCLELLESLNDIGLSALSFN